MSWHPCRFSSALLTYVLIADLIIQALTIAGINLSAHLHFIIFAIS
jgi:hypothetical protein